ncbi:MAG: autotransporter domain-containing protein [Ignavibacteriae bacterium]|nr:autotransporter domain-containing protein [Ignavibacteriota bacterium]
MVLKNIFFLLFVTSNIFCQFQSNLHTSGPSLGFSFLGSTVQLGINHEYGIDLDNTENSKIGKLGIGGIFRSWSYSEIFPEVEWNYTNILFGFQTNYHFKLKNERFDPWAGLIIAYDFNDVNKQILVENANVSEVDKGGLWFGAQAGMRYWLNTKMAFNIRIGFGTLSYSALDLGIDYSFR